MCVCKLQIIPNALFYVIFRKALGNPFPRNYRYGQLVQSDSYETNVIGSICKCWYTIIICTNRPIVWSIHPHVMFLFEGQPWAFVKRCKGNLGAFVAIKKYWGLFQRFSTKNHHNHTLGSYLPMFIHPNIVTSKHRSRN